MKQHKKYKNTTQHNVVQYDKIQYKYNKLQSTITKKNRNQKKITQNQKKRIIL